MIAPWLLARAVAAACISAAVRRITRPTCAVCLEQIPHRASMERHMWLDHGDVCD